MNQHTEAELPGESGLRLYPSAKVTLIDDPESEQACRVTEISLATIQLLADESLPVNELICIELPDHLLLGDVKHSRRRGDKFAMHATRIVTMRKTAVPNGSNIARIDALMADFHLQCKLRLSTIEATIANLETRIADEAGIEPRPAPRQAPDELAASQPSDDVPPAPIRDMDFKQVNFDQVDFKQTDFNWPPPPCVVTLVDLSPPEAQPSEKPKPFNVELPIQAQVPVFAAAGRRSSRPWAISLGFAAVVALVMWGIPWFGRVPELARAAPRLFKSESKSRLATSTTESKAPPATSATESKARPATSTTESKATPAASATESKSRPAASTTESKARPATSVPIASLPIPSGPAGGSLVPAAGRPALLHASIKATGASWIAACSDGKELFQNTLASGDTRELEFSKSAVVLMGNAPVVHIEVNGKPIDPLGVPGVVRAIELGPENARFLSLNDRDTAHACGKDRGPDHSRPAEKPSPVE